MMRAMTAGISGLRAHQTLMDVIGNNIANASSVGYKASRLTFRETLSAQLGRRGSGGSGLAALNPMQIGAGTQVGSIDALFTQGAIEQTSQPFDLAISGRGLFVLSGGEGTAYSRAGNFNLDSDGRLLLAGTTFALQGVNGTAGGGNASAGELEDIRIPLGGTYPPRATSQVQLAGNLRADAAIGETRTVSVGVFDARGESHSLELTFTRSDSGAWSWSARSDGQPVSSSTEGSIEFDAQGNLTAFTYPNGASDLAVTLEDGSTLQISIDAGTPGEGDGVTGFAVDSSLVVLDQDGYAAGELTQVGIDSNGILHGIYSNGVTESLGRVALADFGNVGGLVSAGEGVYTESSSSGSPILLFPGESGGPALISGALEGSNVDLARELTDMIIAQRGFQANARVVMAADEMLSEVSDLPR